MSVPIIRRAIHSVSEHKPFPERLAAIYAGLETAEHAIHALASLDPLDLPPQWGDVHEHAAHARGALAQAPSIRWPLTSPPPAATLAADDVTEVIDTLIDLAEALVMAFAETAGQATSPDDEACCLKAALHTSNLGGALHRSRNAAPPTSPV